MILAGGVAHDFNNLLTGVLGNASLAYESLPPTSPVRAMLKDVLAATERAAHLTKQLLAYAGKGRFMHANALNLAVPVTPVLHPLRAGRALDR